MTQARIRRAFETAIKAFADAQSPPLAIAFENVQTSQPDPNVAYLRTFLLPAETESGDVARVNRRWSGVFQVSLVMPAGKGPGPGEALLAALDSAFPLATPLSAGGLTVWIVQPISASPAIPEPDRSVIPCSLRYVADSY